jgi:magnesium-transporting ATPase (P-type)
MELDPTLYARGTTVVMAGIMMGQLGNLFAARTGSRSALRLSPLRNRWLLVGVFAELCIMAAIVYVPFLQPLFGTAALLPTDWLFLSALAPLAFLLEELRKLLSRRLLLRAEGS